MAYANDPPSKLTARTSAFEHEREKKFNQIEEKKKRDGLLYYISLPETLPALVGNN